MVYNFVNDTSDIVGYTGNDVHYKKHTCLDFYLRKKNTCLSFCQENSITYEICGRVRYLGV